MYFRNLSLERSPGFPYILGVDAGEYPNRAHTIVLTSDLRPSLCYLVEAQRVSR